MQSSTRVPLIVGTVLIVAAVARHRRRAHGWPDGDVDRWFAGKGPGGLGHHGRGPRGLHGRHRHLAARFADCAERLAEAREARDVRYV